MVDKEKIREEVKILKSNLVYGACSSQIAMETRCKEEAYNEVLAILDSLQEEPVSIDFEQELYKAFGQVKDFTLGMRIAKWFYNIGKNSQEPVSDDLEEAIDTYLKSYWGGEKEKQDWPFLKKMAIYFAKWQKEQFEKNRLAACNRQTEEEAEIEQSFVMGIIENEHRQPTYDDAIKYGMRLQKEQMTAMAGNGRVDSVSNRQTRAHITVAFDSPRDIEVLDRIKVVVIKED